MALVVICGQPCSGKSTVAGELGTQLREHFSDVLVVDEPSLHLDRNASYSSVASEKNTRAALRSAADRQLSRRTVVILDSLNSIKGFRYELWCVARTAGTKYCVVHCTTAIDTARTWNAARSPSAAYTSAVFEDLARRFETPNPQNRWDKPLFELQPGSVDWKDLLHAVVTALTSDGMEGHKHTALQPLKATSATTSASLAATNLLHELDGTFQDLIVEITQAQAAGFGGACVEIGAGAPPLALPREVGLPELRRHKRAFLKIVTQLSGSQLQDPAASRRMFADYLQDHVC